MSRRLVSAAVAWVAGLVFALGLGLAGMTRPDVVLGFLDLGGNWQPALLFVMAGAIATHGLVRLATRKMRAPWLAERFERPSGWPVDARLLLGAVTFGVGWGLLGVCPGPAVVRLTTGEPSAWLFAAAMVAGILAAHALTLRSGTRAVSA